jgi:hypothetical protein
MPSSTTEEAPCAAISLGKHLTVTFLNSFRALMNQCHHPAYPCHSLLVVPCFHHCHGLKLERLFVLLNKPVSSTATKSFKQEQAYFLQVKCNCFGPSFCGDATKICSIKIALLLNESSGLLQHSDRRHRHSLDILLSFGFKRSNEFACFIIQLSSAEIHQPQHRKGGEYNLHCILAKFFQG